MLISLVSGTDICPMKSVVRRIGQQLFTALSGKGIAVLVNHGIADEKVLTLVCLHCPTVTTFLPPSNPISFTHFQSLEKAP